MENIKSVALVTGASSGIGRAIAIRLAKDGNHVLAHYGRNYDGAVETLSKIKDINGSGDILQFDVKDSTSIDETLNEYFKSHPSHVLNILVNNAGMHRDNLTGLMSNQNFEEVIQTNLFGPFYLLRWAIKKMIRRRMGHIVNISSLSGQVGNPGQINYAASKAGLIAMTRSLSKEVGSRNIRVNGVAPGMIETKMIEDIPHLDKIKEQIPLKRFGTSEEVAGVVSFLCSDEASYITGQIISVNGGLFPA